MIRQRAYKRKPRLTVIPRDHNSRWVNASVKKGGRVYAICFDLEIELLKEHYPNQSYNNAYADIRAVFERHGFVNQQGSVYFGNDETTPVTCVLAVQEVQQEHPWFKQGVRDLRMLRIEENNDLEPALDNIPPE